MAYWQNYRYFFGKRQKERCLKYTYHANIQKLVTGDRTDALTEEGRQQIRQARVLLDFYSLSFTHYWVSDWIRAKESALIFCPDAHFTVDSRLGETDAGAAADMPLADFTRSHQAFWQNFQPARKYPGGESHQDLYERAVAWLRELECSLSTGVSVLAVTHAGAYLKLFKNFVASTGIELYLFSQGGCGFMLFQAGIDEVSSQCNQFNAAAIEYIMDTASPGDIVFLPSLRLPRMIDQWAIFDENAIVNRFFTDNSNKREEAITTAIPILKKLTGKGAHGSISEETAFKEGVVLVRSYRGLAPQWPGTGGMVFPRVR